MLNAKRVKKYKTVVRMADLNPYWNTSFKIPINPYEMQKVELQASVAREGHYDVSVKRIRCWKERKKFIPLFLRFLSTILINLAATTPSAGSTSRSRCVACADAPAVARLAQDTGSAGMHWREAISQPKTNVTKWHALQVYEEEKWTITLTFLH